MDQVRGVRRQTACRLGVALAMGAAMLVGGSSASPVHALGTGTVTAIIGEASGSYAVGFCPSGTSLVTGSFVCSDGVTSSNINFVNAGQQVTLTLVEGTYTGGVANIAPLLLGGSGPITVAPGTNTTCTFTMGAAPLCTAGPAPVRINVTVAEALGSYGTGFCKQPAHLVLGSTSCSDGSSANVSFLAAGQSSFVTVVPGTYEAAVASLSPLALSPVVTISVANGQTANCSFTMASGASCSVDDGDGVAEPAGVDGNGDSIPDAQQPSVSTFVPAVGGGLVTVAAPDDRFTITQVVASDGTGLPAAPTGAVLPVGVLGFSVRLPSGVHSADVDVVLPPGTAPVRYFKLQAGVWTDFTTHTTISGDVVTLHLVDGGVGDSDGAVNGVIVDPGFPTIATYRFTGFAAPVDTTVTNLANAGRTVPVRWSLTDRSGNAVTDAASFASMTSTGALCAGGTPDTVEAYTSGASGLRSLGEGGWQFNWKTDAAWRGQCRTLTLTLADGTHHSASFRFA